MLGTLVGFATGVAAIPNAGRPARSCALVPVQAGLPLDAPRWVLALGLALSVYTAWSS